MWGERRERCFTESIKDVYVLRQCGGFNFRRYLRALVVTLVSYRSAAAVSDPARGRIGLRVEGKYLTGHGSSSEHIVLEIYIMFPICIGRS